MLCLRQQDNVEQNKFDWFISHDVSVIIKLKVAYFMVNRISWLIDSSHAHWYFQISSYILSL